MSPYTYQTSIQRVHITARDGATYLASPLRPSPEGHYWHLETENAFTLTSDSRYQTAHLIAIIKLDCSESHLRFSVIRWYWLRRAVHRLWVRRRRGRRKGWSSKDVGNIPSIHGAQFRYIYPHKMRHAGEKELGTLQLEAAPQTLGHHHIISD